MSLLTINDLTKNFGGVQALNLVSFAVKAEKILGLIGPNGTGKTTCFNLVNGLILTNAGSICLAGRELVGLPPYHRLTLGLARTFQNIQLFGGMKVRENIFTGQHLGQEVDRLEALLPRAKVRRARGWTPRTCT
jgi:ABC-type branched-subunit amino acid transport system ATPase component